MRRYLLVALWPAGIAAITAATIIAARRAPTPPAVAAANDPAGSMNGAQPAGAAGAGEHGLARPASASGRVPAAFQRLSDPAARPDWLPDLIKLGAVSCAGGVLSYGVMALLGPTVMKHGPSIDEPIVRWTSSHKVRPWAAVMRRLDKVGCHPGSPPATRPRPRSAKYGIPAAGPRQRRILVIHSRQED